MAVLGLLLAAMLPTACESNSTEPLIATILEEVSGNDQEIPAGGAESAPLVVRVLDQFGSRLVNVSVEWQIVSGGGTLSEQQTHTGALGEAQVTYTSGSNPGDVVITATITGLEPVTFKLTATPAATAVAGGRVARVAGVARIARVAGATDAASEADVADVARAPRAVWRRATARGWT